MFSLLNSPELRNPIDVDFRLFSCDRPTRITAGLVGPSVCDHIQDEKRGFVVIRKEKCKSSPLGERLHVKRTWEAEGQSDESRDRAETLAVKKRTLRGRGQIDGHCPYLALVPSRLEGVRH